MELEHNGYRIVETELKGPIDCHGFQMTRVFMVVDEFDDPLPVTHNTFWSPSDAMQAIDFVQEVFKTMRRGQKWPTTKTHELNIAMCYRANFVRVYQALQHIGKTLEDCEEMGDDPTKEIRSTLDVLYADCVNVRR